MKFTRSYFVTLADELSRTSSHPRFIERMVNLRKAPDSERITLGTGVYPEELRKLGVPVPDTLRVSARTFEKPAFAKVNGVQNSGVEPGSSAGTSWESYGSMDEEAYDTSAWGPESEVLPDHPEDPELIRSTIYQAVLAIADFVLDGPFYETLTQLYELPEDIRPQFVLDVFLNEEERRRRGIVVPDTMTIQRSTFYDGRATLFCVSKKENLAYPWRKITITFDNDVAADSLGISESAGSVPAG